MRLDSRVVLSEQDPVRVCSGLRPGPDRSVEQVPSFAEGGGRADGFKRQVVPAAGQERQMQSRFTDYFYALSQPCSQSSTHISIDGGCPR